MRVLVTGVKGQLGFDCLRELAARGFDDVIGIDIEDLDITKANDVRSYVLEKRPDVILHPAAWTAVDKAEEHPSEVYSVNALGPKYLAEAANEIGANIIFISTDYVFPGAGNKPYEVNDPTGPISVYGRTNLEGERFVLAANARSFIIRISWAFGLNGNNFVKTMLRLAESHDRLQVVGDQIGSPTYTRDLAPLMVDMMLTEQYGIYHATNEGFCSWAEFASTIFRAAKKDVVVEPVSTSDYCRLHPASAPRPLNSRLSKRSLVEHGFALLPRWEDALRRYLKELGV